MMLKFFIILMVGFSNSVQACEVRSTSELIQKSKFIVEAIVKEISFKPAELKSCQVPRQVVKKVLKYKITVMESLGKEIPPGDYELSYEYICDIHPTNPVFEVGKVALFAISSVKGQVLTLVGDDCDWWGWDISEKPMVTKFLKAFCTSPNPQVVCKAPHKK